MYGIAVLRLRLLLPPEAAATAVRTTAVKLAGAKAGVGLGNCSEDYGCERCNLL